MAKLLITADVHGSLNTWRAILALLQPADTLVVAGDLFDTRYGNPAHPDFVPEFIRQEISGLGHPCYYVYGNCDVPSFCPGHTPTLEFTAFSRKIFLHHGHACPAIPRDTDIVIQGHTHRHALEKKGQTIFINPGSLTRPKDRKATYGIMEQHQIAIMDFKTQTPLKTLDI
jgi:putative phosphoesterase